MKYIKIANGLRKNDLFLDKSNKTRGRPAGCKSGMMKSERTSPVREGKPVVLLHTAIPGGKLSGPAAAVYLERRRGICH